MSFLLISGFSSKEKMDERSIGAAQTGDVEALYNLIQQDPFVLDKIDQVPFVDTPLHVAISANLTHFTNKIATLKPSFVVNIAIQVGRALAPIVVVQFLYVPLERGLRPFMRSNQLETFKLLFEWLQKLQDIEVGASAFLLALESAKLQRLGMQLKLARLFDKKEVERLWCSFACTKREVEDFEIIKDGLEKIRREEVLNWKDKEGNTVLHLATFTKQCEIIKILLSKNPAPRTQLDVNAVNGNNQTALDILFKL
ncbi:ankyrin repeat-containing protein BDA1-like [Camellia sinensis]|uniref:ankyrin repeat-containing protein BDA1-like n=1 Tax=Camellia sinensis TaxID=4442 RepID=UPI001036894F|nr:ankyrin repeat-containing protein BDA1-like [Camellia sinensis]